MRRRRAAAAAVVVAVVAVAVVVLLAAAAAAARDAATSRLENFVRQQSVVKRRVLKAASTTALKVNCSIMRKLWSAARPPVGCQVEGCEPCRGWGVCGCQSETTMEESGIGGAKIAAKRACQWSAQGGMVNQTIAF